MCAQPVGSCISGFFARDACTSTRSPQTTAAKEKKRNKQKKETRHEPGVCLCAIHLAPEPEERAVENENGEQERLKFENLISDRY